MIHRVSHRNYKLLRHLVTGMGAAVLLPWLVLFGQRWTEVRTAAELPRFSGDVVRFFQITNMPFLILFVALWLLLLGFIYLFDWVNEWFNDDAEDQLIWRTIMVVLIVLILFPLNRILLYPFATAPMFDPARGLFHAIFNFTDGWRPENSLIVLYIVTWSFAIWVTSNTLEYLLINRFFRFGLLANLLAVFWLSSFGEHRFALILPLVACGLTALALIQIESKIALGYHSQGSRFSIPMWSQFVGMIGGFVLIGLLIAAVLLPEQIRSFLALFTPVFRVILLVLSWIAEMLWIVIRPVFIWFFNFVESLIGWIDPYSALRDQDGQTATGELTELPTFNELMEQPDVRYIFVTGVILIGLFIVWVVLNRVILKRYRDESEERTEEDLPEDFDPLGSGLARLRSWLNSFRRP